LRERAHPCGPVKLDAARSRFIVLHQIKRLHRGWQGEGSETYKDCLYGSLRGHIVAPVVRYYGSFLLNVERSGITVVSLILARNMWREIALSCTRRMPQNVATGLF